MKKRKSTYIYFFIFAILCILPFLLAAGCSVSTEDTEVIIKSIGSVTGIVTDAETGGPLFGVRVDLNLKYSYTFDSGQYTIENVEAGEQIIVATKDTYKPYQAIINVIKGSSVYSFEMELEDIDAPEVNIVSPLNEATDMPINVEVYAIFNEPLDETTVTPANFIVDDGSIPVSGTVSYVPDLNKVIFTPDFNLSTGTTYNVTLKTGIKDVEGNALAKDYPWSFTTGSSTDIDPPTVPTGLTATAEESSLITLSWNPSNDDTGIAGYEIRRNFTDIIAFVTGEAYSDDGLQPNTTYDYEVQAVDLAENKSGWSSPSAQATTPPDTPPNDVINFQASPGDGQVTLTWVNPNDIDFDGVWLLRKEGGFPSSPDDKSATPVYNGKGIEAIDPPKAIPPFPPLVNGTTYYYTIYSYDTAGNYSTGVQKTAIPKATDTTPPAEVTNFQVIPGDTQVKLSWTNPKDPDFDIVVLSRDGNNIYKGTGTSFTDLKLINGVTYTYLIRTVDKTGNISKGVSKTAKPEKPASTKINTYYPTHDSFIYAGAPGTNYGKYTILRSGVKELKSKYFFYTMMNFEKVNELAGEKIVKATLRLYYESQSSAAGDEYFHVHMLYPIRWDELSVTWEYMQKFAPYFDPEKIFAETRIDYTRTAEYKEWDVTELVYLWLSDPKTYPNAGLLVKATYKMILDHYFEFHSKENTNAPELVVEYVL